MSQAGELGARGPWEGVVALARRIHDQATGAVGDVPPQSGAAPGLALECVRLAELVTAFDREVVRWATRIARPSLEAQASCNSRRSHRSSDEPASGVFRTAPAAPPAPSADGVAAGRERG